MTGSEFDDLVGVVLIPFRIAISVLVTLHALRTKRDVGSAIGWIGLSWLVPLTGGLLYVMFGVNRVRRLARRLGRKRPWSSPRSVSVDHHAMTGSYRMLSEAVQRLSGRPLLGGNRTRVFHDGDAAYPVMLEAIGLSRSSVLLCSYLFHDDRIGALFVDALIAAHRRGVAVRVMVDGIGSGYLRCRAATRLRAAGVPTTRFMHSLLPWRMPFINLRTHKKILVVDGRIGFTGGMNIAVENVLRFRPKHPVSDTHFELIGPVVHQLSEAFAKDWSFSTGTELDDPLFFPEQEPGPEDGAPMRVITSGPDTDVEKIEFAMMQAINAATRTVRIMTPYFLPDERLLTVLAMAAMRGIEIDVVMPEQSNQKPVDWARVPNNQPLWDAGVRLWLARPPFNHSKLLVIDRHWSLIGSSNLDVRSLRLNFELNVEIYDDGVAGQLDDFIRKHQHIRITHHHADSRRFSIRLRDSAARLMLPYL
ncbi:phospholipase D-like domain-containing protein [Acetobacteraceae bacterium KSS8]|uniref:Phospholipase D n=1 Tax=Endosaccharibacter trunci TaxID=2812733 RepID=A0ABT1W1Z7_9PROT|nr:phospholipase D-like domain-containing protein [Acetobacteraceae bacterium KSS8]